MKSVNPQNQVQAGNLGDNGGVLGAAVGIYARKKQRDIDYNYRTSLMDYDDQLETRRGFNNTVNKIVFDQTSKATADRYARTQEDARSRNKLTEIEAKGGQDRDTEKTKGQQSRRTEKAKQKVGLETTIKMTEGLEKSAGLPLTGGISPLVAGPNKWQGQLQAFKSEDGYHPHMGMPAKSKKEKEPAKSTTFTGASGDSVPDSGKVYPTPDEMPTAAKGGKGKKTKPFADPSVKKNVKPVPDTVASPFGASTTRSTIFADASSPKTNINTAAKTKKA
jgi:hypothetical protein